MSALTRAVADKRTNIRLALGVATVGVLGLFFLYVLFFALMFLSPWLLPRILPFPALSEQVAGLDGKLLIFSKEMNFTRPSDEAAPKETSTLRTYDGVTLSHSTDVPSFYSIYPAGDRVYLFEKGLYRTFDGKNWTEAKTPAIGRSPVGAVSDGDMWVLSNFKNRPVLNLIRGNEIRRITLPVDADKINVCSSQLISAGGRVSLFWQEGYNLFWTSFDGKKWGTPETFQSDGKYKAMAFGNRIFLFESRPYADKFHVALRTYDGKDWSKPAAIPVSGNYIYILPALFRGSPVLILKGFLSQKLYMLDSQGRMAKGPLKIGKPFYLTRNAWILPVIVAAFYLFFLLIIYLISSLIRHFKERFSEQPDEYEYASLFRRFAAYFIDTIVAALLVAPIIYFFLSGGSFIKNPFEFVGLIFFAAISVISVSFLYHSLLEGLWGKTLGKKLCGIVVLGEDFERCTLLKGFLRNIMRIIDSFCYYLVAAVALSASMKWQRLGDIAAGTVVVRRVGKRGRI